MVLDKTKKNICEIYKLVVAGRNFLWAALHISKQFNRGYDKDAAWLSALKLFPIRRIAITW